MTLLDKLVRHLGMAPKEHCETGNRLQRIFDEEYAEFKSQILSQSKEAVYDNAEKISFYETVHDYVQEEGVLSTYADKGIWSIVPIETLWEMYLNSDDLYDESFPDIEELLRRTFSDQEGGNRKCLVIDFAKKAIDL